MAYGSGATTSTSESGPAVDAQRVANDVGHRLDLDLRHLTTRHGAFPMKERMTARARRSWPRTTFGVGTHDTGSCRRPFSNHSAHVRNRNSGVKPGHQPRGTRLGIRLHIATGGLLDRDVIWRPAIAPQLADRRYGLRDLIHAFEADRKNPSQRAARRSGFVCPGKAAAHTGIPPS